MLINLSICKIVHQYDVLMIKVKGFTVFILWFIEIKVC